MSKMTEKELAIWASTIYHNDIQFETHLENSKVESNVVYYRYVLKLKNSPGPWMRSIEGARKAFCKQFPEYVVRFLFGPPVP